VWLTPRNGRSGCGLIVEMPTVSVRYANLPGPEHTYGISVVAVEEPGINFAPSTGTLLSAEEVAEIALDCLSPLLIYDVGQLHPAQRAIVEAPEFENVVAYRVALNCQSLRTGPSRCVLPAIAEDAGLVTLTANHASDLVYYTLDETLPGPANPGAVLYSAPFAVTAGQIIRWAAYRAALVGSDVGRNTVT